MSDTSDVVSLAKKRVERSGSAADWKAADSLCEAIKLVNSDKCAEVEEIITCVRYVDKDGLFCTTYIRAGRDKMAAIGVLHSAINLMINGGENA